jgi:hypothetical protein
MLPVLFFLSPEIFAQKAGVDYVPNQVVFKLIRGGQGWLNTRGEIQHPHFLSIVNQHLQNYRIEQLFPHAEPVTMEEERKGKVDLTRWYRLTYEEGPDPLFLCSLLKKVGIIQVAEPSWIAHPLYTPNDPYYPQQPHLPIIKADLAWDITKGDSNVVIGIVDTGVEWTHVDLLNNIAFNHADPINGIDDDLDGYVDNFIGWDFGGCCWYNNLEDNDPNVTGSNTHGTKVAGLAVATTDNGIGVAGVGFRCRLLPIKCASDDAPNAIFKGYDAVIYAADHGANIINCSWGTIYYSVLGEDAVNYATYNRNALVVAAAGNTPGTEVLYYPASYSAVIAVTGIDTNGIFSPVTTIGYHIDVCAPGNTFGIGRNNNYEPTFGLYTSFCSPIVAGVAALVKAAFPNYTAEQVGQQVRISADNIYLLNPTYQDKLGFGRVNAYRAVTLVSPAIRSVDMTIDDRENQVWESGDTLRITLKVKNLLSPTSNLIVQLVSTNPSVTEVLSLSQSYGQIPTQGMKSNTQPFLLRVMPSVPPNTAIWIKIAYQDGLYQDYEYFKIVVNPTYVHLTAGELWTTVNHTGNWGYNDFPELKQGYGLLTQGLNLLYEGGIVLSDGSSGVWDNIRNPLGTRNNDFTAVVPVKLLPNFGIADETAIAIFEDANAQLPIQIEANYLAFNDPVLKNVLFFRYRIKNKALRHYPNFSFSLFGDFDIPIDGITQNDSAYVDTTRKLVHLFDYLESPMEIGIGLVEGPGPFHPYLISVNSFCTTDSCKRAYLDSANLFLYNRDITLWATVGPFALRPYDSVEIIFALIAGRSHQEVSQLFDTAKTYVYCALNAIPLQVNLGNDTTGCRALVLDGGTPGALHYLWSTGETTPTITVTQSDIYSLTVFDSVGCPHKDEIQVTILQPPQPIYVIDPQLASVGDTITFQSLTSPPPALSMWFFGDGYGSFSPITYHIYSQPDTYSVQLYLSNGLCDTLVTDTVIIMPKTKIDPSASPVTLKLYPNPIRDHYFLDSPIPIQTIELVNATGQLLYTWNPVPLHPTHYHLKLPSGIPEGPYLLRILFTDYTFYALPCVIKKE